jgi:C4-dicarboxylate-specific signal transduction histidine kinase
LSRCGSFFTHFATNERVWSEELFHILELDPSTVASSQLLRSMVHPDDLPMYDTAAARLAEGHNLETDFRVMTASGRVKHLRSVCHIVDWNEGRPVCFGAVQDVTETIAAQEALDRARSELAHVIRVSALGTLTASIAHEVNQPLAGILTNANTCLRMLNAEPPNVLGARETAKRTIRDSQHASEVIARLRALFSRKYFTLGPMDLNDAIREVTAVSLSDLQRNRIVLKAELAEGLPPVMADRIQIQQVILNLVRNATDAMADVNERPRQLLIRTDREGEERARVIVRDSGIGIDEHSAARIFDAFYTTKSTGMGIGLSVSQSIIERHRGRLWVEPHEGPGATLAFSIPCGADGAVP